MPKTAPIPDRAENRRVEFKVVKTKDGPTGVELGCTNAAAHGVRSLPVPP